MNLKLFLKYLLPFFCTVALFLGCGDQDPGKASSEAFYPIDFCIVTGNDFDDDSGMIPYTHVHEGVTIKFCCKPCLPKFNKDPKKYLVILEEEIEALKQENLSGS